MQTQVLTQHWQKLSPRDRYALKLATLVLAPLLTYLLLWQPATQAISKLEQTLPVLRSQAAQLQANAREIQQLRQLPQPALQSSSMLISAIQSTAEPLGLTPYLGQIQSRGEYQVSLQIESVPFVLWIDLLRELQATQHIRIQSSQIVALPTTGYVRVNATFTTGAEL